MQKTTSRSLDHIVGEQIAKWQCQRIEQRKKTATYHLRPCITVSRDPGSGGTVTAERYVYRTEADRNAFHCKHFGTDWTNPIYYDLTLNTGVMGIEGAVAAVEAAFATWDNLRDTRSDVGKR